MSLRSRTLQFRHFNVSFPQERILQVTLNRPEKLNCIDLATSREIQEVWEMFDRDESLWVGIITGIGRAFCTGADLLGTLVTIYPIATHPTTSTDRTALDRMERDEQGRSGQ
jgi:enoyl-CoA hydratase/carnithine racemase